MSNLKKMHTLQDIVKLLKEISPTAAWYISGFSEDDFINGSNYYGDTGKKGPLDFFIWKNTHYGYNYWSMMNKKILKRMKN